MTFKNTLSMYGYRCIILVAPMTIFVPCLQLCYEVCRAILVNNIARDAVGAYKDGKTFTPEVVAMLEDSFPEEDSAVSFHQSHMHMYHLLSGHAPFFRHDRN